jgi:2-polyprenyl-3-methyl-5-hydroxy-6-metoxy-1,4-benzoquinol methylase
MNPTEVQQLTSDKAAREGYVGDSDSNRCRKVAALMQSYPNRLQVLDVGCATGSLLKPFTGRHEISGVDISEMLLEKARANGYARVQRVDASTERLPFPDGSFDLVFSGECIEHVVDTDWVLCEINRVLRPAGELIMTFPNVRTPISLLMMMLNLPPMLSARYRATHLRDFTTRTMRIALGNSGFRVQDMIGSDFYIPGLDLCLPGLAHFIPSWATTVVVRANKERRAEYCVEDVASAEMTGAAHPARH